MAHIRALILSVDFLVTAALVAAGVLLLSGEDIRNGGRAVLIPATAMCAGLLGLVLTTTGWVSTSIDDVYRRVLQNVPGGFAGALLPFKEVAVLSGFGTACGLIGIFGWGGLSNGAKEAITVAVFALTVWSFIGAIQLVFLNLWHGQQKVRLLDIAQQARREVRRRQTELTPRGRR